MKYLLKILILLSVLTFVPYISNAKDKNYELSQIQENVYIAKLEPRYTVSGTQGALTEIAKTKTIIGVTSLQEVGNSLNEGSRTIAIIIFTK